MDALAQPAPLTHEQIVLQRRAYHYRQRFGEAWAAYLDSLPPDRRQLEERQVEQAHKDFKVKVVRSVRAPRDDWEW